MDYSLSVGSIEIYLRCSNLTGIEWDDEVFQSFNYCYSLLRVDLSGCPKLERI